MKFLKISNNKKVFEKIRSCSGLHSGRVQTLVSATRRCRRLVRGRTERRSDGLWQFLPSAFNNHEPSNIQDTQSSLFILQRRYQDIAQRPYERFTHLRQSGMV